MAAAEAAAAATGRASLADGTSAHEARSSAESHSRRASAAEPFARDETTPLRPRTFGGQSGSAASAGQASDVARQAGDGGGDAVDGDTATPVRLELPVSQDTVTPPKRRRLVGKQRPPSGDPEALRLDLFYGDAADAENRSMYARSYGHFLRWNASSLREAARDRGSDAGALRGCRLGPLRSMSHDSRVQAVQRVGAGRRLRR